MLRPFNLLLKFRQTFKLLIPNFGLPACSSFKSISTPLIIIKSLHNLFLRVHNKRSMLNYFLTNRLSSYYEEPTSTLGSKCDGTFISTQNPSLVCFNGFIFTGNFTCDYIDKSVPSCSYILYKCLSLFHSHIKIQYRCFSYGRRRLTKALSSH